MQYLTAKNMPIFALLLSGGLLGGALFFEHVLGYAPCTMCYWQRHAHKVVLALAILALGFAYFKMPNSRLFAMLIGLVLLLSFALAFWHMGVEYKWWEGPKECAASGAIPDYTGMSYEEMMKAMDAAKPPSCSEAVWHLLGLSMAGWNALISFLGAVVCFLGIRKTADV